MACSRRQRHADGLWLDCYPNDQNKYIASPTTSLIIFHGIPHQVQGSNRPMDKNCKVSTVPNIKSFTNVLHPIADETVFLCLILLWQVHPSPCQPVLIVPFDTLVRNAIRFSGIRARMSSRMIIVRLNMTRRVFFRPVSRSCTTMSSLPI